MVALVNVAFMNASCAFVLGIPLNAVLLFWAIRRHTPDDLRPYARLLQQTSVTDFALLVVNFLVSPVRILWVILNKTSLLD
jgi:hypothetical protein